MSNVRLWLHNNINLDLPTTEPLWTPKQGLQKRVNQDGTVSDLKPTEKISLFSLSDPAKRKFLYETMHIKQNITDLKGNILVEDVPGIVKNKVDKIFSNKIRYAKISHKFPNPIQWYHVGLLHEMECSQNFNKYLGNGQSWNKRTTIVPKGRGPFRSFEEGAIDAIRYDKLDEISDWSIGHTLYILEGFNGYGYSLYKGINSPYLFSGSDVYESGKYISDRVYSPTAVSQQIGIALLLKEILSRTL